MKKTKPTPEPGFFQQIGNATGEHHREVTMVCPMYSVTIHSSHARDTLLNMKKMGLSVLRELRE
jgi:hypothetical protein